MRALAAAFAAALLAAGCNAAPEAASAVPDGSMKVTRHLDAGVDVTRLDAGAPGHDATMKDANAVVPRDAPRSVDASTDAADAPGDADDAGDEDSGEDAAVDAYVDAAPDSGSLDSGHGDAPPLDARMDAPVDAPVDAAAELACDEALVAAWQAKPPSVGLASTSAASTYGAVFGELMAVYGIPGGAVAVVENGQLVLAMGYGWADQDKVLFAHPDSVFRIASLSKQITSAAVLMLVQQGVASLSDTPFTMLGIAPLAGKVEDAVLPEITVNDLLHHTGGWNSQSTFDPMFDSQNIDKAEGMTEPPDCDQILAFMMSDAPTYAPGTTYAYSNFGYCVLGAYIEKITGMTYPDWVAANILAPLGYTRIQQGHTLQAEAADGEVTYYDYPGDGLAPSVFPTGPAEVPWQYGGFYIEAMAAHGAWISSPVDLLRFQVALDGRGGGAALLTPDSISEMVANPFVPWATSTGGTTPASSTDWYGDGWLVNSAGNWWHMGNVPGTATEQVHAANGWGWAAFFNTRPENENQFLTELDDDLWTAFNGTSSWLTVDLFNQYGEYTAWMTAAEYDATFATEQSAGNYPSRVEGQNQAGTNMFRGVFAPFEGAAWQSRAGLDCLTFQSEAASLESEGYAYASLQSFVAENGRRVYQATWVEMQ